MGLSARRRPLLYWTMVLGPLAAALLPLGPEGGLGAVGDADALEDAGEVGLHRLLGDAEAAGDLLVGQPLREQAEHLPLPGRQLRGRPALGTRREHRLGRLGRER